MDDTLRAALGRWLGEQRRRHTEIVELRRIATGNSRANWFVATGDGERHVVRIEQGGVFGTSSVDEFRMMQVAGQLGCPVAPVRWMEPTGEVLGAPFFVMDFVDGVAADRNDRTLSPELAEDMVRQLDALHRSDWRTRFDLPGAADATRTEVDRWYGIYRAESEVAIPLLEEGAAWLHHHARPVDRPGIVHGDPGPGNFVHDGARVVAFTDWEFTHVGDPMEDWVYLVTMRGASTMPRDAWLALFARVAGVTVSDRDLHYWSVFNFFKGACANLTCLRVFRTVNPAPNMALIGTALHQNYVRRVAALIEEADDDT